MQSLRQLHFQNKENSKFILYVTKLFLKTILISNFSNSVSLPDCNVGVWVKIGKTRDFTDFIKYTVS